MGEINTDEQPAQQERRIDVVIPDPCDRPVKQFRENGRNEYQVLQPRHTSVQLKSAGKFDAEQHHPDRPGSRP